MAVELSCGVDVLVSWGSAVKVWNGMVGYCSVRQSRSGLVRNVALSRVALLLVELSLGLGSVRWWQLWQVESRSVLLRSFLVRFGSYGLPLLVLAGQSRWCKARYCSRRSVAVRQSRQVMASRVPSRCVSFRSGSQGGAGLATAGYVWVMFVLAVKVVQVMMR